MSTDVHKMEATDHARSHSITSEHTNDLKQTMTLSPEQFEKLYLDPKREVKGDLRKTFANPTPMAIMGFCVALTPLSVALMGWRGAGGAGVATVTASIFFGGMLLIIAGLLEFVLGNNFPFLVFMGYGTHYLTFGTTFVPFFNAISALATDPAQPQVMSPTFDASFGFYTLAMAILTTLFLICSLRTNVAFLLVFAGAWLGFVLATGAFWNIALGNLVMGTRLLKGTGGAFFVAAMVGWYLLFSMVLAQMDMPYCNLPVFDLSQVVRGASERRVVVKDSSHEV